MQHKDDQLKAAKLNTRLGLHNKTQLFKITSAKVSVVRGEGVTPHPAHATDLLFVRARILNV